MYIAAHVPAALFPSSCRRVPPGFAAGSFAPAVLILRVIGVAVAALDCCVLECRKEKRTRETIPCYPPSLQPPEQWHG